MHEHLTPELSKAALAVIREWDIPQIADTILSVARPCIHFNYTFSQPETTTRNALLGGFPEMPGGMEWPRHGDKHIPFIAQINLAALPQLRDHPLPTTGILYFFCWCTNEITEDPCRVIWAKSDVDALRVRILPESKLHLDWRSVGVYERILTTSISPGLTLSKDILEQEALKLGQITQMHVDEDVFGDFPGEFFSEVDYALMGQGRYDWGRSLGYLHEESLLGFDLKPGSDGYCDGDATWINLLQVSSVGNMQWSDVGYLAFLIRADDLKREVFDSIRIEVMSS
jgi:hypothetical protein